MITSIDCQCAVAVVSANIKLQRNRRKIVWHLAGIELQVGGPITVFYAQIVVIYYAAGLCIHIIHWCQCNSAGTTIVIC